MYFCTLSPPYERLLLEVSTRRHRLWAFVALESESAGVYASGVLSPKTLSLSNVLIPEKTSLFFHIFTLANNARLPCTSGYLLGKLHGQFRPHCLVIDRRAFAEYDYSGRTIEEPTVVGEDICCVGLHARISGEHSLAREP